MNDSMNICKYGYDDITKFSKEIYDIPAYAQDALNLSSMVNYSSIYMNIIDAIKPKLVCEIGSEKGENTRNIAKLCQKYNTKVHVIEPNVINTENIENVSVFKEKSIEYLSNTDVLADIYYIDGDHNFNTVYQELVLIGDLQRKIKKQCVIFLHDTAWPWAFRNLYYQPDNVIDDDIVTEGSVSIFDAGISKHGLLIDGYGVSAAEGRENKGVRAAVTKYIEKYNNWDMLSTNIIYGLSILWSRTDESKELKHELMKIRILFEDYRDILNILEINRIRLLQCLHYQASIWSDNQQYIKLLLGKIHTLKSKLDNR